MATPFSFDGEGGILERWATHYDADATVDALGNVPAELLAMEFSLMDPIDQYITKYVRLYENLEDEEFVRNFARMEQWIWDGVDVAGEVYREFITEIYQDNRLVRGEYHLGDDRIDVSEIEMPVQQIVGEYDHIVPPESSKPLNDAISSADERLVEFSAGHIGISVSGGAHADLWPDVCDWLADRDTNDTGSTADGGADATGDSVTGTNGHAPEIETIRGIGPTYAERLHDAGIDTVADLAEYDPETLAEIADTSASRTSFWLEQGA
jgi:polyhydroxyalkanoate synthase